MRKWFYILAFMACAGLRAQDIPVEVESNKELQTQEKAEITTVASERSELIDYNIEDDDNDAVYLGSLDDSLHLPTLDMHGGNRHIGWYPFMGWGITDWNLHEGMNVSLGTSVFSQFGHHAYHGAGFTQSVAAMYAVPLTSKLSVAFGGYYDHVNWAHQQFHDAGISAVVGYMLNPNWETYVFAQKSLTNSKMPMPLYPMGDVGDRIGAGLKYNVSPSFSVELNVHFHDRKGDPFRPFPHGWPQEKNKQQ